jgi:ESCRT-II complex subunit VPS25
LILNYCKHKRIFLLDIAENQSSELFNNKKIDRKCSPDLIISIIDYLVKNGKAEWVSDGASKSTKSSPQNAANSRKCCYILWHTVDEWAKIVYDYVNKNGMQNTVCTFYELTESDDCKGEEFFNIDKNLFVKCLTALQQQRRAELISLNGEMGVKFF